VEATSRNRSASTMRFLRLRLRTLMILVAIVAMLLGRSVHFSNLARHHGREKTKLTSGDLDFYLLMAPDPRGFPMHPESGLPIAKAVVPIRAFVAYHWELEKKYESASRHPWLPVAPDPVQPPEPSKVQMELYRTLLNEP
jgi:hypothetical protein